MNTVFPKEITNLPAADIRIAGARAHISQGDGHQVIFMQFSEDIDVPAHAHEGQWGVVVAGTIDLTVGGVLRRYSKGDSYYIPAGVEHSARIYAGYADVTYFDAASRYRSVSRENA